MGFRTTVLESCHILHRRPQFAAAVSRRDGDYRVTVAACGCENRTRIVPGHGPSCDGATDLCPEHAIPDED